MKKPLYFNHQILCQTPCKYKYDYGHKKILSTNKLKINNYLIKC